MRIAYLHGLESNPKTPKNEWLRTFASAVYDPAIKYTDPGIYKKLLREVKKFKPDVIIGSSMGGYFAYKLAKTLAVPAILFNPALHTRSTEPDMTGDTGSWHNPKMKFIFGKRDKVIDPIKTIEMLGIKGSNYEILDHGHQTPYKVFVNSIIKNI